MFISKEIECNSLALKPEDKHKLISLLKWKTNKFVSN